MCLIPRLHCLNLYGGRPSANLALLLELITITCISILHTDRTLNFALETTDFYKCVLSAYMNCGGKKKAWKLWREEGIEMKVGLTGWIKREAVEV